MMQILSRFWYLLAPLAAIIAASAIWAAKGVSQSAAQREATLALLSVEQHEVTATDLVFVGWGDDVASADATDLVFVGWGDEVASADATGLVFVGWGDNAASAEATDLVFVGWGDDVASTSASDLVFVGLGPEELVIDRFDDGGHGWVSSDGAEAIRVSDGGTLCIWDIVRPSTYLTPPEKFLGDWGGPGGELSFRVYYEGTVQWPIVVTLQSSHGRAVRREMLNAYNDKNFEDVTMPIGDIWWEETGDWDAIIRSVDSVSIEFDIKDGLGEDPEGCIDDFKLVKGHRG